MIERIINAKLKSLAAMYPVVTVTGPRQSGKTTLCQSTFPDKNYISLEPLDRREYATRDPRGLLAELGEGAVIDEIQHAPGLLSYLQDEVDARPVPGRFIITGSQHFGLMAQVTQSLAGRTGVLFLLPPALDELVLFPTAPGDLPGVIVSGAYPRIHDRGIPARQWLADYVTAYVERDVRQVLNVVDLAAFTTFMRLCAGRTGQEMNLNALGSDAGVTHNTARSWLSVLEAGFIIARIPAWHRNVRKQAVRAAKIHFLDSGLACHLLGIEEPGQLAHHPLRGPIFESWVAAEVMKWRLNRGMQANLHHFREVRGIEVDLMVEGRSIILCESKSGATVQSGFVAPLGKLAASVGVAGEPRPVIRRLVYGGDDARTQEGCEIVPWRQIANVSWE
ncbi:MAG: ATP-binding protein [Deltaproteobacteria bacterium]|nr:ATP-binding protein [Deltaproteobacteria bacterium]